VFKNNRKVLILYIGNGMLRHIIKIVSKIRWGCGDQDFCGCKAFKNNKKALILYASEGMSGRRFWQFGQHQRILLLIKRLEGFGFILQGEVCQNMEQRLLFLRQ
jgi:hypothetical protein